MHHSAGAGQAPHTLVEFEDADSWVQLTGGDERTALEDLKPELPLPLSLGEKVLGIMSPGQKQSEELFSATDLKLRKRGPFRGPLNLFCSIRYIGKLL